MPASHLVLALLSPLLLAAQPDVGPAAKVLTPAQAARQEGKKVTVQFKVKATGTNAAGYAELYSEKAWDAPGCFFVRFPAATQTKLRRLKIPDAGKHFVGEVVRVTGKVEPLPFEVGNRPCIYVTDLDQIEVVPTIKYAPTGAYQKRTISRFTVLVHPDLLARKKEAALVFKELERQLEEVHRVVPRERVVPLLKVRIWLEWENPLAPSAAQFHPSKEWLQANGYNPDKVNGVEISDARKFVQWSGLDQPCMLLHELAHAYHFRVLGENHAGVRAAYKQAMERKLYDEVLHANGSKQRAYAATNEKEYFAELTEAYFGKNDFFPFTRAELRKHDPVGFALMERTWAPDKGKGP